MIKRMEDSLVYFHKDRVTSGVDLAELGATTGYRVGGIASYLGVSVRTLERDFKATVGVTPKSWLREQRAMRLPELVASGQNLKDVCRGLGFKRHSHFAFEIKKMFDVKPGELAESCFAKQTRRKGIRK